MKRCYRSGGSGRATSREAITYTGLKTSYHQAEATHCGFTRCGSQSMTQSVLTSHILNTSLSKSHMEVEVKESLDLNFLSL